MWVAIPSPPVVAIQIVVPDQRDSGQNDGGEREVGQGEPKQQVEIAVPVGEGRPGQDENLKNVENDGDEPGTDSPTRHEAGARRVKIALTVISLFVEASTV